MTDATTRRIQRRLDRLPDLATRAHTSSDTTTGSDDTARRPSTPGPRLPAGVNEVLDAMTIGREHAALLDRLGHVLRLVGGDPTRQRTWADRCTSLTQALSWAHGWQLDVLDSETADIERILADRIHRATGRCAYCAANLEPRHIGPLYATICAGCDRVTSMRLTCKPEHASRWASERNLERGRRVLGLVEAPTPHAQPMAGPDIAELLGLSPHTIRSWASRGLIQPAGRDDQGRRTYNPDDIRAIAARRNTPTTIPA